MPHIQLGGDFKDLVTKSDIFADKSLLIKDIVEEGHTALLIAMPRRWGKTVNLNILKRFLELLVDGHGNQIDRLNTDNYKLFAGGQVDGGLRGEVTLNPLKISKQMLHKTQALEAHGMYPVTYIDFKNCKGSNYDTVQEGVKRVLRSCFLEHNYIANSAIT